MSEREPSIRLLTTSLREASKRWRLSKRLRGNSLTSGFKNGE